MFSKSTVVFKQFPFAAVNVFELCYSKFPSSFLLLLLLLLLPPLLLRTFFCSFYLFSGSSPLMATQTLLYAKAVLSPKIDGTILKEVKNQGLVLELMSKKKKRKRKKMLLRHTPFRALNLTLLRTAVPFRGQTTQS